MDKIITVNEDHVPHISRPLPENISYDMKMPELQDMKWLKINSLGFGQEGSSDKNDNGIHEIKRASRMLAASGVPFSILCERRTDDQEIAFAIGTENCSITETILYTSFGTAVYENYTPCQEWQSGLYARNFCAIDTDKDGGQKKNILPSEDNDSWADTIAYMLMNFPGMARIDFYPAGDELSEKIKKLTANYDIITKYLETNVSRSTNIAYDPKDDFIAEWIKSLKSDANKKDISVSDSVSWKHTDMTLDKKKNEYEYYYNLFDSALKDGWYVGFTVSADIGLGKLKSSQKEERENSLILPISAAILNSGYTFTWDVYSSNIQRSSKRGLVVNTSSVTDLICFPSRSYYGFERVKNQYYSMNIKQNKDDVHIADLMHFFRDTGTDVSLPREQINRHMFVMGMTGSGKTNTVYQLLSSVAGNIPFLIIEPVKSEYSSLPGVTAYTMTVGSKQALCFNPFWFPYGGRLQYHIDCLKQIISSAFYLYAAMPNILEQCLNRVYQHFKWDIVTGKNLYHDELPENMLYPTFSDLCREVEDYIEKSGFGDETKSNYRGALLSRLQSFTSGAKGILLNNTKSIPYDALKNGYAVISLDSLADDSDKSIVMGSIIAQYYEYIKIKCRNDVHRELKHIIVIEEAHHLFSADTSVQNSSAEGGSGQSASLSLVKTLNNMLAEIRAYGEGVIMVDQSPSALHPAVLKNTGIKIAHRIDYGEDIKALRSSLLLDEDDNELAALMPGEALIRFGGMRKPAKVYIKCCSTKENSAIIPDETISGSSFITHLQNDDILSKRIQAVSERLLNHLLYDDLEGFPNVYSTLCSEVDRELVMSGYIEIVENNYKDDTVMEYILSFIPKAVEKLLPHQYGTAKIISFFASRFLSVVNESKGRLTPQETAAFDDYRKSRVLPRISRYWKYVPYKDIQDIISVLGEAVPETALISDIIKDMLSIAEKNGEQIEFDSRELELGFEELLEKKYFLTMPCKHIRTDIAQKVLKAIKNFAVIK